MTSNPEEKRKTIGDVFVKVSLSMSDSHPVGLNIKLGVEHSCFAAGHYAFLFVDPSPFCQSFMTAYFKFDLCIMCVLFLSVSFQWFFHHTFTFVIFCDLIMFKPEEEVILLPSVCYLRI